MCKDKNSCLLKTVLALTAVGAGVMYILKNFDVELSIKRKPRLLVGEPEEKPEVYIPEYVDMEGVYEAEHLGPEDISEQTISEEDVAGLDDVISLSEPQETVAEDWDKQETEAPSEPEEDKTEDDTEGVHYQKL